MCYVAVYKPIKGWTYLPSSLGTLNHVVARGCKLVVIETSQGIIMITDDPVFFDCADRFQFLTRNKDAGIHQEPTLILIPEGISGEISPHKLAEIEASFPDKTAGITTGARGIEIAIAA